MTSVIPRNLCRCKRNVGVRVYELSLEDGILLKNHKILIPKAIQNKFLEKMFFTAAECCRVCRGRPHADQDGGDL